MLEDLLLEVFPHLQPAKLPQGIQRLTSSPTSSIKSTMFSGGAVERARICYLLCPGAIWAETLVIYPQGGHGLPIFGCEYLNIGSRKFMGAVDIHPIDSHRGYEEKFLGHMPTLPTSTKSKFYDLDQFFSNKLWLKSESSPFYISSYIEKVREYLEAYKECLEACVSAHSLLPPEQVKSNLAKRAAFNQYMRERDPARGILKAHFSKDFAETYLNTFLFPD